MLFTRWGGYAYEAYYKYLFVPLQYHNIKTMYVSVREWIWFIVLYFELHLKKKPTKLVVGAFLLSYEQIAM